MRVLVTHGLGFLPQCDKIVVMENGKITEVGQYSELVDNNGAFAEFLRNYATTNTNEEGDPCELGHIFPEQLHHTHMQVHTSYCIDSSSLSLYLSLSLSLSIYLPDANEYSEFEDEVGPIDDSGLNAPSLSDDAETHARRQAARSHVVKRRARHVSAEADSLGGGEPLLSMPYLHPCHELSFSMDANSYAVIHLFSLWKICAQIKEISIFFLLEYIFTSSNVHVGTCKVEYK